MNRLSEERQRAEAEEAAAARALARKQKEDEYYENALSKMRNEREYLSSTADKIMTAIGDLQIANSGTVMQDMSSSDKMEDYLASFDANSKSTIERLKDLVGSFVNMKDSMNEIDEDINEGDKAPTMRVVHSQGGSTREDGEVDDDDTGIEEEEIAVPEEVTRSIKEQRSKVSQATRRLSNLFASGHKEYNNLMLSMTSSYDTGDSDVVVDGDDPKAIEEALIPGLQKKVHSLSTALEIATAKSEALSIQLLADKGKFMDDVAKIQRTKDLLEIKLTVAESKKRLLDQYERDPNMISNLITKAEYDEVLRQLEEAEEARKLAVEENKEAQSQFAKLKTRAYEAERSQTDNVLKISSLEKEVKEMKRDLTEFDEVKARLEESVREVNKELSFLQNKHDDSVREYEAQIKDYKSQLDGGQSGVERNLLKMVDFIKDIQSQFNVKEKTMMKRLESQESALASLKTHAAQLKAIREKEQSTLADMKLQAEQEMLDMQSKMQSQLSQNNEAAQAAAQEAAVAAAAIAQEQAAQEQAAQERAESEGAGRRKVIGVSLQRDEIERIVSSVYDNMDSQGALPAKPAGNDVAVKALAQALDVRSKAVRKDVIEQVDSFAVSMTGLGLDESEMETLLGEYTQSMLRTVTDCSTKVSKKAKTLSLAPGGSGGGSPGASKQAKPPRPALNADGSVAFDAGEDSEEEDVPQRALTAEELEEMELLKEELQNGDLSNIGQVANENFDRLKDKKFGKNDIIELTMLEHHLRYDSMDFDEEDSAATPSIATNTSAGENEGDDEAPIKSAEELRREKRQLKMMGVLQERELNKVKEEYTFSELSSCLMETEKNIMLLRSFSALRALRYYNDGGNFMDVLTVHRDIINRVIEAKGGWSEALREVKDETTSLDKETLASTDHWPDFFRIKVLEFYKRALQSQQKNFQTAMEGIQMKATERTKAFKEALEEEHRQRVAVTQELEALKAKKRRPLRGGKKKADSAFTTPQISPRAGTTMNRESSRGESEMKTIESVTSTSGDGDGGIATSTDGDGGIATSTDGDGDSVGIGHNNAVTEVVGGEGDMKTDDSIIIDKDQFLPREDMSDSRVPTAIDESEVVAANGDDHGNDESKHEAANCDDHVIENRDGNTGSNGNENALSMNGTDSKDASPTLSVSIPAPNTPSVDRITSLRSIDAMRSPQGSPGVIEERKRLNEAALDGILMLNKDDNEEDDVLMDRIMLDGTTVEKVDKKSAIARKLHKVMNVMEATHAFQKEVANLHGGNASSPQVEDAHQISSSTTLEAISAMSPSNDKGAMGVPVKVRPEQIIASRLHRVADRLCAKSIDKDQDAMIVCELIAQSIDDWKHGFMEDALDNVNHIFEVVQDTHHADLSIVHDVIELLHMDVNVPKEALEVHDKIEAILHVLDKHAKTPALSRLNSQGVPQISRLPSLDPDSNTPYDEVDGTMTATTSELEAMRLTLEQEQSLLLQAKAELDAERKALENMKSEAGAMMQGEDGNGTDPGASVHDLSLDQGAVLKASFTSKHEPSKLYLDEEIKIMQQKAELEKMEQHLEEERKAHENHILEFKERYSAMCNKEDSLLALQAELKSEREQMTNEKSRMQDEAQHLEITKTHIDKELKELAELKSDPSVSMETEEGVSASADLRFIVNKLTAKDKANKMIEAADKIRESLEQQKNEFATLMSTERKLLQDQKHLVAKEKITQFKHKSEILKEANELTKRRKDFEIEYNAFLEDKKSKEEILAKDREAFTKHVSVQEEILSRAKEDLEVKLSEAKGKISPLMTVDKIIEGANKEVKDGHKEVHSAFSPLAEKTQGLSNTMSTLTSATNVAARLALKRKKRRADKEEAAKIEEMVQARIDKEVSEKVAMALALAQVDQVDCSTQTMSSVNPAPQSISNNEYTTVTSVDSGTMGSAITDVSAYQSNTNTPNALPYTGGASEHIALTTTSTIDSEIHDFETQTEVVANIVQQHIDHILNPLAPPPILPPGFQLVHCEDNKLELCPGVKYASFSLLKPHEIEQVPKHVMYIHRGVGEALLKGMKRLPKYIVCPRIKYCETVKIPVDGYEIIPGVRLILNARLPPHLELPVDVHVASLDAEAKLPPGMTQVTLQPQINIPKNLVVPAGLDLVQCNFAISLPPGTHVAKGCTVVAPPPNCPPLPPALQFIERAENAQLPDFLVPTFALNSEDTDLFVNAKMSESCSIVKRPYGLVLGAGQELLYRPPGHPIPPNTKVVPIEAYPESIKANPAILNSMRAHGIELIRLPMRIDLPETTCFDNCWYSYPRPHGMRLPLNVGLYRYDAKDGHGHGSAGLLPACLRPVPMPNVPYGVNIPPNVLAAELLHTEYSYLPPGTWLSDELVVLPVDSINPRFGEENLMTELKAKNLNHFEYNEHLVIVQRIGNTKAIPKMTSRATSSDLPQGILLEANMEILMLTARYEVPPGVKLGPGTVLGNNTQLSPESILHHDLTVLEWPYGCILQPGTELVKVSVGCPLPHGFQKITMDYSDIERLRIPPQSLVVKLPHHVHVTSNTVLAEKITIIDLKTEILRRQLKMEIMKKKGVVDPNFPNPFDALSDNPFAVIPAGGDIWIRRHLKECPLPGGMTQVSKAALSAQCRRFLTSEPGGVTRKIHGNKQSKFSTPVEVVSLHPTYSLPIGVELDRDVTVLAKPSWLMAAVQYQWMELVPRAAVMKSSFWKRRIVELRPELFNHKLTKQELSAASDVDDIAPETYNADEEDGILIDAYTRGGSTGADSTEKKHTLPEGTVLVSIPDHFQVYRWGPHVPGIEVVRSTKGDDADENENTRTTDTMIGSLDSNDMTTTQNYNTLDRPSRNRGGYVPKTIDYLSLPKAHFFVDRPFQIRPPPGFRMGLSPKYEKMAHFFLKLPPGVEIMHIEPTYHIPHGVTIETSNALAPLPTRPINAPPTRIVKKGAKKTRSELLMSLMKDQRKAKEKEQKRDREKRLRDGSGSADGHDSVSDIEDGKGSGDDDDGNGSEVSEEEETDDEALHDQDEMSITQIQDDTLLPAQVIEEKQKRRAQRAEWKKKAKDNLSYYGVPLIQSLQLPPGQRLSVGVRSVPHPQSWSRAGNKKLYTHKPRVLEQIKDGAFSNLMPTTSAAEMRRAMGGSSPSAPTITGTSTSGNYEDDATKELDLSSFDRGVKCFVEIDSEEYILPDGAHIHPESDALVEQYFPSQPMEYEVFGIKKKIILIVLPRVLLNIRESLRGEHTDNKEEIDAMNRAKEDVDNIHVNPNLRDPLERDPPYEEEEEENETAAVAAGEECDNTAEDGEKGKGTATEGELPDGAAQEETSTAPMPPVSRKGGRVSRPNTQGGANKRSRPSTQGLSDGYNPETGLMVGEEDPDVLVTKSELLAQLDLAQDEIYGLEEENNKLRIEFKDLKADRLRKVRRLAVYAFRQQNNDKNFKTLRNEVSDLKASITKRDELVKLRLEEVLKIKKEKNELQDRMQSQINVLNSQLSHWIDANEVVAVERTKMIKDFEVKDEQHRKAMADLYAKMKYECRCFVDLVVGCMLSLVKHLYDHMNTHKTKTLEVLESLEKASANAKNSNYIYARHYLQQQGHDIVFNAQSSHTSQHVPLSMSMAGSGNDAHSIGGSSTNSLYSSESLSMPSSQVPQNIHISASHPGVSGMEIYPSGPRSAGPQTAELIAEGVRRTVYSQDTVDSEEYLDNNNSDDNYPRGVVTVPRPSTADTEVSETSATSAATGRTDISKEMGGIIDTVRDPSTLIRPPPKKGFRQAVDSRGNSRDANSKYRLSSGDNTSHSIDEDEDIDATSIADTLASESHEDSERVGEDALGISGGDENIGISSRQDTISPIAFDNDDVSVLSDDSMGSIGRGDSNQMHPLLNSSTAHSGKTNHHGAYITPKMQSLLHSSNKQGDPALGSKKGNTKRNTKMDPVPMDREFIGMTSSASLYSNNRISFKNPDGGGGSSSASIGSMHSLSSASLSQRSNMTGRGSQVSSHVSLTGKMNSMFLKPSPTRRRGMPSKGSPSQLAPIPGAAMGLASKGMGIMPPSHAQGTTGTPDRVGGSIASIHSMQSIHSDGSSRSARPMVVPPALQGSQMTFKVPTTPYLLAKVGAYDENDRDNVRVSIGADMVADIHDDNDHAVMTHEASYAQANNGYLSGPGVSSASGSAGKVHQEFDAFAFKLEKDVGDFLITVRRAMVEGSVTDIQGIDYDFYKPQIINQYGEVVEAGADTGMSSGQPVDIPTAPMEDEGELPAATDGDGGDEGSNIVEKEQLSEPQNTSPRDNTREAPEGTSQGTSKHSTVPGTPVGIGQQGETAGQNHELFSILMEKVKADAESIELAPRPTTSSILEVFEGPNDKPHTDSHSASNDRTAASLDLDSGTGGTQAMSISGAAGNAWFVGARSQLMEWKNSVQHILCDLSHTEMDKYVNALHEAETEMQFMCYTRSVLEKKVMELETALMTLGQKSTANMDRRGMQTGQRASGYDDDSMSMMSQETNPHRQGARIASTQAEIELQTKIHNLERENIRLRNAAPFSSTFAFMRSQSEHALRLSQIEKSMKFQAFSYGRRADNEEGKYTLGNPLVKPLSAKETKAVKHLVKALRKQGELYRERAQYAKQEREKVLGSILKDIESFESCVKAVLPGNSILQLLRWSLQKEQQQKRNEVISTK